MAAPRVVSPRMAGWVFLALVVACAPAGGMAGRALEPRFVAVHNALAAMGMAQVGPIHEGVLAEGREAKITLDLPAGCTTIAAVGGDGVRDLDATVLDAQGHPLAHDTTGEPQAVLRTCLEAPDTYVLVVKVASGAGAWIAATWQGGAAVEPWAASSASSAPKGRDVVGTCESPIPLAVGTVSGSTAHGERENAGSCGGNDARELVYELDVPRRARVIVEVEARFDSVLYIRKDDCADPNAEIECSDDAPDRNHSRIERVLEPGKYFVFVDSYAHDAGSFKLTVSTTDVLALADQCRRASPVVLGTPAAGTTAAMGNDAQASCGGGAAGADAPWRMELASRSRVRVLEHSEEMTPVVHLRRSCVDEQSELACGASGGVGDAVLTGVFDPGGYTIFADAHDREAGGHYSLLAEAGPTAGSGASGDACGDALPLGTSLSMPGDTFAARDDVAGSCGGEGAADVVYRFEAVRRSRFVAALQSEEAPHLLVLWKRCADRRSEVACGRNVDALLAPGAYFIAVDGLSEDAFGRFTLVWSLQDLSAQAGACRALPTLVEGSTVVGTTLGAGDKFAVSCAGGDSRASGPDRAYKLSLAKRTHVRLVLTASSFDAAIALRKACEDRPGSGRATELTCESEVDMGRRITIDRVLETGAYWVVVDGQTQSDQGPFTLEYRSIR